METKIGAGSALEPRSQSTRATSLAARGYHLLKTNLKPYARQKEQQQMHDLAVKVITKASIPSKFLTFKQVSDRVNLTRSPLYRRIREGSFPKPVKLGAMSRWVESEIDAWMSSRISARDGSSFSEEARTHLTLRP